MPGKKPPLEPLARLRADHVERATTDLAGKLRARERATRDRVNAEDEERTHAERAKAIRDDERERLEGGELTAADLHRGVAWELQTAREKQQLERTSETARDKESRAEVSKSEAQAKLGVKKAEAEAVDRYRERWQKADAKKNERKEEEEAAEAWRDPKRGR